MRRPMRMITRAWGVAAICLAATVANAADPPPVRTTTSAPRPPVIGTHQIDRYAAIERLQATLKENPQSLSDWIILGELAHEVGEDVSPDQSAAYFKLSRQAYEKALALAPDKPGLQAAVQFARDYEEGAQRFSTIRDRATATYLDARRRDLAATGYVPAVRAYAPVPSTVPTSTLATVTNPAATVVPPEAAVAPRAAEVAPPAQVPPGSPGPTSSVPLPGTVPASGAVRATRAVPVDPAPAVNPPPTDAASTNIANFGTRQIYTSPYSYYQPFAASQGSPYTFQQYSRSYYPPGIDADSGQVPVTLQRFMTQDRVDANRPTVNPDYTAPTGTRRP